jgi:hypothetical protein
MDAAEDVIRELVAALSLCTPSPAVPNNFNKKHRALDRARRFLSGKATA